MNDEATGVTLYTTPELFTPFHSGQLSGVWSHTVYMYVQHLMSILFQWSGLFLIMDSGRAAFPFTEKNYPMFTVSILNSLTSWLDDDCSFLVSLTCLGWFGSKQGQPQGTMGRTPVGGAVISSGRSISALGSISSSEFFGTYILSEKWNKQNKELTFPISSSVSHQLKFVSLIALPLACLH